jgi:hypothetical protein
MMQIARTKLFEGFRQMSKYLWLLLVCILTNAEAYAADTYEASTNILTIQQVKVADTLYSDVKITVGSVVSIGSDIAAESYDTYNPVNGQLSIPVVSVGNTNYYNVVITVGTIINVGASCTLNGTCSKVGTPEIRGVLPGDSRISVMFNFMGGKITTQLSNTKFVPANSYTAICISSNGGVSGSSRTSAEFSANSANYSNPLVVSGLSNGKTYTCTVTASAPQAVAAISSNSVSVIPNAGSSDANGLLANTANIAHSQAYPNYSSYCNYTNQSATGLPAPPVITYYNSSGVITNGTSQSTITCTATERTITGNAIPDHRSSEFFTSGLTGYSGPPYFSGNPNSLGAKTVNKTVPLNGTISTLYNKGVNGYDTDVCYNWTSTVEPSSSVNNKWTSGGKVWVSGALRCTWIAFYAYLNNSVKVEPGTAETYTNTGKTYNIVGKNLYQDVGLDPSNAHNQPTITPGSSSNKMYGYYHLHGMPEGLVTRLGKGNNTMTLIGFAVDGFPIYARYGYSNPNSISGGVSVMKSNYRIRTAEELIAAGYSNRPSSSIAPYGTFEQDWVFDATSGSSNKGHLDACNGRYGVTPESPSTAVYHYFITDAYPFVPRCVFGTPASWANDGAVN